MYTLFALLTRLRYWNSEMPRLRSHASHPKPNPVLQTGSAKRT
jgi:hypothetical protein